MKLLIIFLLALLLLQGCASAPRVIAVPTEKQKTDYDGGVVSQKKHLVSVSHYSNFKMKKNSGKKNVFFYIVVQNCGEKPFSINRDNISVLFKAYGNKSKPLYIKSINEFILDINTVNTKTPTSFLPGNSGKSVSRESFEHMLQDEKDKRHELEALKDAARKILLRPKTILPDDANGGIIVCDGREIGKRTRGNFIINILVDNEIHEFTFARFI